MTQSHPAFTPPADLDVILWRYMDFTKFVAMLDTQSLYFTRSDKLGDPFEGSYTRINIELRRAWLKEISNKETVADPFSVLKRVRRWMYINCWHMNPLESAAMWKLYAKTDEAIAIQTTYRRLTTYLPQEVYCGVVQYKDYDREQIPEGNVFYPFLHKQRSFEHEREVRAILDRLPQTQADMDLPLEKTPEGIRLGVNLNDLVTVIFVAPNSKPWFQDLVNAVSNKYDLKKEVKRSSLEREPLF